MPINNDQKRDARRKSMLGTALFGLGIIAAIAAVATGAVWLGGLALVLLLPAVILLHGVGKALP